MKARTAKSKQSKNISTSTRTGKNRLKGTMETPTLFVSRGGKPTETFPSNWAIRWLDPLIDTSAPELVLISSLHPKKPKVCSAKRLLSIEDFLLPYSQKASERMETIAESERDIILQSTGTYCESRTRYHLVDLQNMFSQHYTVCRTFQRRNVLHNLLSGMFVGVKIVSTTHHTL